MEQRTEVVSIQLDDQSVVKVRAVSMGGYEEVADFDRILPMEQVTSTIEKVAAAVSATLDKVKPQKASVEFGLEIGVESGALSTFLVKGAGSGNLKISLEWERKEGKKG